MKVFGGVILNNRFIVSAKTKKRMFELLKESGFNMSLNHFNDYWSETGNKTELEYASKFPEKVLIKIGEHSSAKYIIYKKIIDR